VSFLPPVVMEIRANAAQFLKEQEKVVAAAKATAMETSAAAEKEATAAAKSAAAVSAAADRKVLAEEKATAAQGAAVDKRIAADLKATESAARAAEMQAEMAGVGTAEQTAAYDKQALAATRASVAAETAAAREVAASERVTAAAAQTAAAKERAAAAEVVASERAAAAAEVSAVTQRAASSAVLGIANKTAMAVGLTGLVVAGVGLEMAAKFQKSTTLLVTAGGESKDAIGKVSAGMLEIAAGTGTSAEQVADGMYIMEKASFRGADGLTVLKAAAQGAKAENVDLAVMAQAVTDVLLDYGKGADQAVSVTNQMVTASGLAKTTMTDFANSMAAVIPIGSAVGLSFEQLGGAIATMTQHGQSAQQSSQNLANLIQQLQKPSNVASTAMQQIGVDAVDLSHHLGDRGLSGTLRILSDAVTNSMGPGGMVVQDTMKKSKTATEDLRTMIATMPPELAKMSQAYMDGDGDLGKYTKSVKTLSGSAAAMGLDFISLAKKSQGFSDAIKGGSPQFVTYNAEMTKLTGGMTGFKAATMLMMNDSKEFDANIKAIGESAKNSGKDIATWADTQSTLSVQLDMAKQMVSKLFIEIGTNLIPVAKDAISGFSDLFHGFEQGNPVLLGFAAVLGGVVLIAIANYTIKMAEAAIATVKQLVVMGASALTMGQNFVAGFLEAEAASSALTGKMGTMGGIVRSSVVPALGALGIAAAGTAVFVGVLAANTDMYVPKAEDMLKVLADLAAASDEVGKTKLDDQFKKWPTTFGSAATSATDLSTALATMKKTEDAGSAGWDDWTDSVGKSMGITGSAYGVVKDRFKEMGEGLGTMVKGGSLEVASKAFDKLALGFTKNGKSAQDALDVMPAYRDSLIDAGHAAGVELSQQELLEFAMGKVPASMQNAAGGVKMYTDAAGNARPMTDQMSKALDEVGVSADGQIVKLGALFDVMVKTGLANLSARDSEFKFGDAIRTAAKQAEDAKNSVEGLGAGLNAAGDDFSKTTAAGKKAEDAFSAITQAGLSNAQVMAHDVTKSQGDVQGALTDTYNSMVTTAKGFGLGDTAAVNLARSVLNIPKGVDIKSFMEDTAKRMADQTKASMDAINGKTVQTYVQNHVATYFDKAVGMPTGDGGVPAGIAAPNRANGGPIGSVALATGGSPAGLVYGGGSSKSDSVAAHLSIGEYVTQTKSVSRVGLPFMEAVNEGRPLPQPASGPGFEGGGDSHMSVTNNNITVNASTNASAPAIAGELGWALRHKS
jgi:TP901 family phage tail tape measure protein